MSNVNIKAMSVDKNKVDKLMKEKGFKTLDETLRYLVSSGEVFNISKELSSPEDIKDLIKGIVEGKISSPDLSKLAEDYHEAFMDQIIDFMDNTKSRIEEIVLSQCELLFCEIAEKHGEDIAKKMLDEADKFSSTTLAKSYNHAASLFGESDKSILYDQVALNSMRLAVSSCIERKKNESLKRLSKECNCSKCRHERNSEESEKETMQKVKDLFANNEFDSLEDMFSEAAKMINK